MLCGTAVLFTVGTNVQIYLAHFLSFQPRVIGSRDRLHCLPLSPQCSVRKSLCGTGGGLRFIHLVPGPKGACGEEMTLKNGSFPLRDPPRRRPSGVGALEKVRASSLSTRWEDKTGSGPGGGILLVGLWGAIGFNLN